MSAARTSLERLMAEWRDADARVEALRQFQKNGGGFRLQVTSDGENFVPGNILDDLLRQGEGFHVLLRTGIKEAERKAEAAKQAFLAEAVGESIGSSVGSLA